MEPPPPLPSLHPPTLSLVAKGITDGRRDCSPLPDPANGIKSSGPSGTWLQNAGEVGNNEKITSDRWTVDDGRISTPRLSDENKAEERTYTLVASGLL